MLQRENFKDIKQFGYAAHVTFAASYYRITSYGFKVITSETFCCLYL